MRKIPLINDTPEPVANAIKSYNELTEKTTIVEGIDEMDADEARLSIYIIGYIDGMRAAVKELTIEPSKREGSKEVPPQDVVV